MRVFISYSHRDKATVSPIVERLRKEGHDIWIDSVSIRPGDNIPKKLQEGLSTADVILAIISENSLRSDGVRSELSAAALGQLSRRQQRIIPILIDGSSVPSYLSTYMYLDLSLDVPGGIDKLVAVLATTAGKEFAKERAKLDKKQESFDGQVATLRRDLRDGHLTLVCGAGVSVGAGIPTWNGLLVTLLASMMKRIAEDHPIDLESVSGDEFQKRYGSSALIVGKYLRSNLGKDFLGELRAALYVKQPTTCALIDAIVDLARPQRDGKPLDSIVTFNFDSLIEENLERSNIRNRPIYTEAIRHRSNELPVYHVHGFLPRGGKIPPDAEVVFSEDAYHSQFMDSFSWSNLVQLTKLSQNTCLFIGLSMTDPNLRRLLDVAQRKSPEKALSHFIMKKTPQFSGKADVIDDLGRLLEEQDANALGLNVIWIEDYDEIPSFIRRIAET
jgi:hypothetical protein